MPIYEYKCPKCGAKFEKLISMSQRDNVKCEKCGNEVDRVYNGRCAFGANAVGKDGCSGNCASCPGCRAS